jgi:flagellar hook-length control protein FliK
MPGEIHNNTRYPALPVDVLSPAGGNTRHGNNADGFDSLLRSLAPPQRPVASNIERVAREDDKSQFGATDSLDSAGIRSSVRDRDDQRNAVEGRSASERTVTESSQSEDRVRDSDEPANADDGLKDAPESATAPTENTGDGSESESEAKADDGAVAGQAPSEVTDPELEDDADETAAIDPNALQLAALAAQAPQPIETAPAKVGAEEPTDEVKEVAVAVGSQGTEPKAKVGPVTPPAVSVEKSPVELAADVEPVGEKTSEVGSDTLVAATQQTSSVEVATAESPVAAETEGAPAEVDQVRPSELHSTKAVAPQPLAEAQVAEVSTADPGSPTPEEPSAEISAETADPVVVSERSESKADDSSNSEQRETGEQKKNDQSLEAGAQPITERAPEALPAATTEAPPADASAKQLPVEPTGARHPASLQTVQPTLLDGPPRPPSTPRLAAELLTGGARETSHTRPIEIDSARFLTRVAKAFSAAQQRGGEVTLRLSPPELGSLRVEVKILDGVMTARVETENATAQAAVLEHLPQLRERLAEQNVRIERFDVDLMQDGSSGTPDRPSDRETEPVPRPRASTSSHSQNQKNVAGGRPIGGGVSPSGGLNVIV